MKFYILEKILRGEAASLWCLRVADLQEMCFEHSPEFVDSHA
jgi:hypothetical protein